MSDWRLATTLSGGSKSSPRSSSAAVHELSLLLRNILTGRALQVIPVPSLPMSSKADKSTQATSLPLLGLTRTGHALTWSKYNASMSKP